MSRSQVHRGWRIALQAEEMGGTKALWHKPTLRLCCLSLDIASSSIYSQHILCVFLAPRPPLVQHHHTLFQRFADLPSASSGIIPCGSDHVVLSACSNI